MTTTKYKNNLRTIHMKAIKQEDMIPTENDQIKKGPNCGPTYFVQPIYFFTPMSEIF